ncbi:MAG: hypothetical protein JNJ43_17845 [Anaerolineales bacterium]|nr:hypothetical protein [Anaerolineales bacterium]
MFRVQKYFFIFLIISSLACAVPAIAFPEQPVVNTETSIPVFTETITPTSLPTFTFTPTLIRNTARPVTETFTPEPSLTFDPNSVTASLSAPTIEPVTITVSRPTNCRIGPGTAYEIAGTLLVGEKANVLGRDPSNKYWFIPNPDPGLEYCWVWGEYATLTGNTLVLPVYTPIATPTSTPTALPDITFDLKGLKTDKCGKDFWVEVQITNTSENKLAFNSVKIEIEDTENGTRRISTSNNFINRDGCGTYSGVKTLVYEASAIISGPSLPYNPSGHVIRVFVTACSEADLKGSCRTIRISITP